MFRMSRARNPRITSSPRWLNDHLYQSHDGQSLPSRPSNSLTMMMTKIPIKSLNLKTLMLTTTMLQYWKCDVYLTELPPFRTSPSTSHPNLALPEDQDLPSALPCALSTLSTTLSAVAVGSDVALSLDKKTWTAPDPTTAQATRLYVLSFTLLFYFSHFFL